MAKHAHNRIYCIYIIFITIGNIQSNKNEGKIIKLNKFIKNSWLTNSCPEKTAQ